MKKNSSQHMPSELEALQSENAHLKNELKKYEAHVNSLLHGIPDLVWLKDENGVYLNCNHSFEIFFGAPKEEIIGKTDYDFVDEKLADFFRANDHAAMLDNKPRTNEEWVTFASNGRRVLLETIKTPLRNANNELVGILGVARDITERKQIQERLEFKRQILLTQLETSPDGILIEDENIKILAHNQQFIDLWGFPETLLHAAKSTGDSEALLNYAITQILEPEKFLERVKWLDANKNESSHDEIRLKDGRFIDQYSAPIITPDGKHHGRVWYFRDITDRKRHERDLKILTTALEQLPDTALLMDRHLSFVYANEAATQHLGYSREELSQMTAFDIDPDFAQDEYEKVVAHPVQYSPDEHYERRHRARDGRIFPVEISLSSIEYEGEYYCIAICRDITERKKHEEELNHVANHDMITGLPNRRLLTDRLKQAIRRAERSGRMLAICYLDLDNFKPINDKHGHNIGDQLLVNFTQHIKSLLRADDTLARLGGDEFVLLLNDLDSRDDVHVILERLLEIVNMPRQILQHTLQISASIGVALYPEDDVDADTLLRHADQAMYGAKSAGKNCYHLFDPLLDRQLQERSYSLEQLRRALNKNEFVLHYQPKVDLLNGKVMGAEALIRWQHPERGLLAPGEFIHYIEASDIETAIGEWVIDAALKQIDAWRSEGLHIPVSVNISAGHLLSHHFAEQLHVALMQYPDLSPENLEIEILETATLSDLMQTTATLARCRQLGVKVSLDDFGTGYSSLTYLRQLPVDILKIDQSFVRDMLNDPSDRGIVVSVVQLAETFNRDVIAEGVETLEQGVKLIELGCQTVQGYAIAPPMPAEQIPSWINQWRKDAVWEKLQEKKNGLVR